MAISIFELFSIGIGPSSSHTVGPMRAARQFALNLGDKLGEVTRIEAMLHGSLAFTGKGHGTNKAILMGLEGETPEGIDPDSIPARMQYIENQHELKLLGTQLIHFHSNSDLIFNYKEDLPYHPNGMQFKAFAVDGHLIQHEIYYSIGGGFIVNEAQTKTNQAPSSEIPIKYPFKTAQELFMQCETAHLRVSELMFANEQAWRKPEEIRQGILNIARIMEECINKGCHTGGILEGGLQVKRRASALYQKLLSQGKPQPQHTDVMNWLNVYAMAVNEENAAGGRVVTAPTNGAAGIIPATLNYYKHFCPEANEEGVIEFLLTAAAIGILYKLNASISGAEMGCQGEVGVACSMAAGALAAALGGSLLQVENAAEIGMEHNLGLTCDPVGGLVQIPCIERNAMGTVKAVNAARLALAESDKNKVSLDMVINTMREIGHNMNSIYKETSKGGLAVNVPEC